MAFLPELALLLGALGLFGLSLGENRARAAQRWATATAAVAILAALGALPARDTLFEGAYRVDAFSQWLKLVLAVGYLLVVWQQGELPDIPDAVRPEYHLFLALSVSGLMLLVSSIELITLFVALELASLPLYFLVAMRRERAGQRVQMESAIKYLVFGITANGLMLFGLSWLFGLTGTTYLPEMMPRLAAATSAAGVTGLGLTCCGLFYKLAVFPFHFWTPDVYQGASNETAGYVATLPKLGAAVVLVRLAALAEPASGVLPAVFTALALASMFYGNLIALAQTDLKRLLGFSGIAHAGYALVGFVALTEAGFTAALYYLVAYLFMALACFTVFSLLASDGANLAIADLAGLHRRSPLLAGTLAVGVFGLAGVPPLAGFMGKLALLTAAWERGHRGLVLLTMVNAALAIYYYLALFREAFFRDPPEPAAPIRLTVPARALCAVLIAASLVLGLAPGRFLETVSGSLAGLRSGAEGRPIPWSQAAAAPATAPEGSR